MKCCLFFEGKHLTEDVVNDHDGAGLCKAAHGEHARDLPIMNGIKEDIKSIGVMHSGSPAYQEALFNLSSRLRSLLVRVALK